MPRHKLYIAFAILLTLVVALFNYRLRAVEAEAYAPGKTGPDVVAQLDGLSEALDEGAAESMQQMFPEGYVFTWALYGLSWVQVGMNEPEGSRLHDRAVREARRADYRRRVDVVVAHWVSADRAVGVAPGELAPSSRQIRRVGRLMTAGINGASPGAGKNSLSPISYRPTHSSRQWGTT